MLLLIFWKAIFGGFVNNVSIIIWLSSNPIDLQYLIGAYILTLNIVPPSIFVKLSYRIGINAPGTAEDAAVRIGRV